MQLEGRPSRPARPAWQEARRTAVSPAAGPAMALSQGDRVEHSAFGQGTVLSVQPMGGDALVEIAFDGVGVKRLMLRAAAPNMEKM